MKTPFISCIVPVYNVESYLGLALDSILKQNFHSYEIILVDDGSTDDSSRICDEYSIKYPDRIRVYHTYNKGVSAARNKGIENARGELLYFMDSDDQLAKDDVFYQYYKAFQADLDIDLVVQGYTIRYVDVKSQKTVDSVVCYQDHLYDIMTDQQDLIKLFPHGFMFVVWNKAFKRSLILRNKISFKQQQMEDFRFVLDYLSVIKKVYVLSYDGYIYYRISTQKSLVTRVREGMMEDYLNVQLQLQSIFSEVPKKIVAQIMFPQYYATVIKHLSMNKVNDSVYAYLGKFLLDPQIKECFNTYKPVSFFDMLSFFLIKNRLFRCYRFYRKLIDK